MERGMGVFSMVPTKNPEPSKPEHEVTIDAGGVELHGTLALPANPAGVVLFAHGSGSSRHSPRNRYVAGVLQSRGVATLLFDLLTKEEESVDQWTAELRFDIPMLAQRLFDTTRWSLLSDELKSLKIGYFGASTGAAAALVAAARLPDSVRAVVSRGGRPDLAGDVLESVHAPTLLIVVGNDEQVIDLNRIALEKLHCHEKKLVIVPGATHLFEEPGTLEEVARLAADWFADHFKSTPQSRRQSSRYQN